MIFGVFWAETSEVFLENLDFGVFGPNFLAKPRGTTHGQKTEIFIFFEITVSKKSFKIFQLFKKVEKIDHRSTKNFTPGFSNNSKKPSFSQKPRASIDFEKKQV